MADTRQIIKFLQISSNSGKARKSRLGRGPPNEFPNDDLATEGLVDTTENLSTVLSEDRSSIVGDRILQCHHTKTIICNSTTSTQSIEKATVYQQDIILSIQCHAYVILANFASGTAAI